MFWNKSGGPGLPTRPVLPHFLVLERVFRILLKCLTLLTAVTAGPHWVGLCSSLHKYGFSQFYILIGCPRQKCVLCYKKWMKATLSKFEWFKLAQVWWCWSGEKFINAMWVLSLQDLKLKLWIFYSHVQSHTLNNPYVCTTIWNKKPEYSNLSSLWVVVTSVLKKK